MLMFLVLPGSMIVKIMFSEKLKFSCILSYLSFSASFCGFLIPVFCIQIFLLNTFSHTSFYLLAMLYFKSFKLKLEKLQLFCMCSLFYHKPSEAAIVTISRFRSHLIYLCTFSFQFPMLFPNLQCRKAATLAYV